MGQTMAEKILSAHAGREARAGDLVIAELDYVMAGDAKGPKAVDIFREAGFEFRMDPKKTDFIIDHFVPAQDVLWANHHRKLRIFGAEFGVEVFEPGAGVCHTVVTEEGRVGPGALTVGGDSHVCTYGALGAMGVAVESVEIASAYATGKLWFKTPESVRVEFTGALAHGVFSKDMELVLAREMGENGANYMAVEYGGSALADLSMDARFTIANMSVDMGAKTGIMDVDEKALSWARAHGAPVDGAVSPDPDAVYARKIHLDISELTPVVAAPPATGNAHPVEDYAGLPVQQAFVGTCTKRTAGRHRNRGAYRAGQENRPRRSFLRRAHEQENLRGRRRERSHRGIGRCGGRRAHRRVRALRLDDGKRLSGRRGTGDIVREPQFSGEARQQGSRNLSGFPGHGGGERGDGPHY